MKHSRGLAIPTTLEDLCNPQRMALLVYDMQVGICSQIKSGSGIVTRISRLLALARATLIARMLLCGGSLAALRRAVLTRCAIRRDHGVGSGHDTVATVRFSLREPTSHLRDCRARTGEMIFQSS